MNDENAQLAGALQELGQEVRTIPTWRTPSGGVRADGDC